MERSIVKKTGLLPGLFVSLFLVVGSVESGKAEAAQVCCQTRPQVAWWAGYHGWGWGPYYSGPGYYRPGYYRPGYYRSGYGYYAPACERSCWRNRWGNLRCARRCF